MGKSVFHVDMTAEEIDDAKLRLMGAAQLAFIGELAGMGHRPTEEVLAAWTVGFVDGFEAATVETARMIADTLEAKGHDVSQYLVGRI